MQYSATHSSQLHTANDLQNLCIQVPYDIQSLLHNTDSKNELVALPRKRSHSV